MKRLFLVSLLTCFLGNRLLAQQKSRNITIDFKDEKGLFNQSFKECIGAGRANEGLRADWQQQLLIAKKECDFKYIRFHGVFHDDMGVYKENEEGTPIYNWQYVDKLYDLLLENNIKPFVELSFMPTALASGDRTVFWWKGNVTPPKSFDKYYELIKAFTQHLTDRYGVEEVKAWYFEVWNEPNHSSFFTGKKNEYFTMYKYAVKAIKEVCPQYKVGGPATAGCGWISEFLTYCKENEVPADFVSTHAYNVHGDLDEFGKKQLIMDKSPNSVINGVEYVDKKMKELKRNNLELHFTEWSSSYSPADAIHDTYQNASYVLNTLKNVEGITNSMSYWVFTDIFEEPGVPMTPFHGGFGLMNLQGIKKPTYYVYHYLNQLGKTELLNSDSSSWVCKEGNNIQMLLWDFSYPDQGKEYNQVYFRRNLPSIEKENITIEIKNLVDGRYNLEIFRTGYKHNDPFTAYYEMGLPSQITRQQVQELKEMSSDKPVIQELVKVKGGIYKSLIKLNENDICFLKLTKL